MTGLYINTVRDLVTEAMSVSGLISDGQTPSNDQINAGVRLLNGFTSTWQSDRMLAWAEDDVSCVSNGAVSYTIGISPVANTVCDFNTPRPDKIMAAYARILPVPNNNPLDYQLKIIKAHEDYARIPLKRLNSYPTAVFYDSQFPVGNIFVYPIPTANQWEIHLIVKNQTLPFTSLGQVLPTIIPQNYIEAMKWGLAARMIPAYQLPPNPGVVLLAKQSLDSIRAGNVQPGMSKYGRGYPRGGRTTDPWWAGIVIGNSPYGS